MAATKMKTDQLPFIPINGATKMNNSGKEHPAIIIKICFHFI